MATGVQNDIRAIELDALLRNEGLVAGIRQHLEELAQSKDFRGSQRSQQFLRYVVDKTLEGSLESLKERTIGVELFQRSPTYDTGEDAIVRVTASDVRRRLLQHYGRYEETSPFRIHLPSGSYVPEIEYEPVASLDSSKPGDSSDLSVLPLESSSSDRQVFAASEPGLRSRRWRLAILSVVLAVAVISFFIFALLWRRAPETAGEMSPWKAVFRSGHAIQIVTSDPNVEELQELIGKSISLSDYANQKYVPDDTTLSPELRRFYDFYLHADNAAVVDTPLAVNLARLVPENYRIRVRSARSLRIADLQTDDNLVLIGSPRSNPWFDLFGDQLDFKFVYSQELNQEIIENVHPLASEQSRYLPTARGFATGESFAIIAFLKNPNQSGHVVLLAGANGEGTEAAGNSVTDRTRLSQVLQYCRISPKDPIQEFELLLHLHTMAGSPNVVEMVACHRLPGRKTS